MSVYGICIENLWLINMQCIVPLDKKGPNVLHITALVVMVVKPFGIKIKLSQNNNGSMF